MRPRAAFSFAVGLGLCLLPGRAPAEPGPGETDVTVSDPDEAPARPAPQNPTYIEGRGFDFKTADGLFDLALGANLQLRFSDLAVQDVVTATEFRVRRAKLYLTGYAFDPRLTYRVQLAFENPNNVRLLDDAFVNWKFADWLQAQMGQSKTPYGRQELMNDAVLMFTERSIAIDSFKPNRDIGFVLLGYSPGYVFQYGAGVFGGAGQGTLRTTNHVMPIARVVWSTFGDPRVGEPDLTRGATPRFSVGANGFDDTLKKTTATSFESAFPSFASATGWLGQNVALFRTGEDVEVTSGGLDYQIAWCGFTLQGEYLVGHAHGKTSGFDLDARGYYVETSGMILPVLGAAVRYSSVDSNRDAKSDVQSEVNGALTYYFRKHNVKVTAEYTKLHRQRPTTPANDHFFRL